MVTIVLLVSRIEFLSRVITSIELLDCNPLTTSLLCVVDGDNELYVKTRNLINGTKFQNRLCVQSNYPMPAIRLDIPTRRRRIAAAHNQAKELIGDNIKHVFLVEDDTLIPNNSLSKLLMETFKTPGVGIVQGVELGRWGTPYVGAWLADDIYEPKLLTSVDNLYPKDEAQPIDAGGMYCTLVRADLYKQHEFTSENTLGPDINLGLELRTLGYTNLIRWDVGCVHLGTKMGNEIQILPTEATQITRISKRGKKWVVLA